MKIRSPSSILLLAGLLVAAPARAANEAPTAPTAAAGTQGATALEVAPQTVRRSLAELRASIEEWTSREAELVAQLERLRAATSPGAEAGAADAGEPDASAAVARDEERRSFEAALEQVYRELEIRRAAERRLQLLESRFAALPDPAQRALDDIGTGDESLRSETLSTIALVDAARALADRLDAIRSSAEAGRLGGFISERERIAQRLGADARALRELAQQLEALGNELRAFGESEVSRGEQVRTAIADALLAGEQARIDALYVEHLDALRAARRRAQAAPPARAAPIVESFRSLLGARAAPIRLEDAEVLASEAERVLGLAGVLHDDLAARLARFGVPLERQLVTALEPMASEETRRKANRLSRAVLSDIRSEGRDAAQRLAEWAEQVWAAWPHWLGRWHEWLGTACLVLALCGAAVLLGTRRVAPMPALIRHTARLPIARGRVGAIVRWGNLAQAVFPPLACVALLYWALLLIGTGIPAIWAASVLVSRIGAYRVGARILSGLTRPVSRSRPALLTVASETSDRLERSYRGLGPAVGLVILDELAAAWLGVGRLRALIDLLLWAWLGGWALGASIVWRAPLATSWARDAFASEAGIADWMSRSPLAFVLTPVAAVRVAGARTVRAVRAALAARGFFEYVRAKWLRRMAREAEQRSEDVGLPERYTREFPLYPLLGDEDAVILSRNEPMNDLLERIDAWRSDRVDGSLVLLGEKGLGKTTLVGQVARRITDLPVHEDSLGHKIVTEAELARWLGPLFGADQARSVDDLIEAVKSIGDCIVVLDEAHNLFLRTIGGYRAFDAMVRLVNATSDHVFWLVVFNSFSWEFINESRGRMHYFRRLMTMPRWSVDELQDLIGRRNSKAGFDVRFDPMLLDAPGDARDDFRLIESADGFFRMLWETSGGNPRIALYYWLRSLVPTGENALRVRLFAEPALDRVEGLQDEGLYILAAICQHENLSAADLSVVLRMPVRRAEFAIQFLRERTLIEPKHGSPDRMSLSPRYYLQTLRLLRRQNLLFEGK